MAFHRSREHGRTGHGHRRDSRHRDLLHRRRHERDLEDDEQRDDLPARVRQRARRLDGRPRDRAEQPRHRVGGNRRGGLAQLDLAGRRHLQVRRRRAHLGVEGARGDTGDRPHRRPPDEGGLGVRRRARAPVGRQRGARPVSHEGRRRYLGARELRVGGRRIRRHRHAPAEPGHPLGHELGARARPVLPAERRPRQRDLEVDRRGRHVGEGGGQRPPGDHAGTARDRHRPELSPGHVRDGRGGGSGGGR